MIHTDISEFAPLHLKWSIMGTNIKSCPVFLLRLERQLKIFLKSVSKDLRPKENERKMGKPGTEQRTEQWWFVVLWGPYEIFMGTWYINYILTTHTCILVLLCLERCLLLTLSIKISGRFFWISFLDCEL